MGLYVISTPTPSVADRSLHALIEFLGLQPATLTSPPMDEADRGETQVVATCESLARFCAEPHGRRWMRARLARQGSSLFLTGITPSAADVRAIAEWLPGVVERVVPAVSGSRYEVAGNGASGMPQFEGLSFGTARPQCDATFVLSPDAQGVTSLVEIDGRPCYVRVERDGVWYHLLACTETLDLDAPAPPDDQAIDRFLEFVPLLGYLRSTFGPACWHNPRTAACLVIDDPVLRKRYGFLEFDRLDAQMERARFSTNIAFIPWNYKRTDRSVAKRFVGAQRRFSISIHGCDHTEAEFGETDERWLRSQARRAMERMRAHEALTGIRHDRVMVFPQGVFSRASLEALADEGFVAAVNSTVYSVDASSTDVTYRDLLSVAVVRAGSVPLFMRHYPDRFERIALDLFLGRQVLIVEHHGFFKSGYDEAARCAAFVNRLAPAVTWTNLEELCASACLERTSAAGRQVLAFGPIVRLTNRSSQPERVSVRNRWGFGRLRAVTWKGRRIDHQSDATATTCEVVVNPGDEDQLLFDSLHAAAAVDGREPTMKRRLTVFARRHLSEVRDNHLARHEVLARIAKRGRRLLPRL